MHETIRSVYICKYLKRSYSRKRMLHGTTLRDAMDNVWGDLVIEQYSLSCHVQRNRQRYYYSNEYAEYV